MSKIENYQKAYSMLHEVLVARTNLKLLKDEIQILREYGEFSTSKSIHTLIEQYNMQLNESMNHVQRALKFIQLLKPKYTELLYLKYFKGLKSKEYEETMGISPRCAYDLEIRAFGELEKILDSVS